MKKKDKLSWVFNGQAFEVGESITEPWHPDMHHIDGKPAVFCKGKVYTIHHGDGEKYGLRDIYSQKLYWTVGANVFQIIAVQKPVKKP